MRLPGYQIVEDMSRRPSKLGRPPGQTDY